MCVCVSATLVVVVDAARWRAPVFLPVVDGEGQVVVQRVMGVGGGAGDVVGRVVAIDLDQPSADVTYRVVDGGGAVTSPPVSVDARSGELRLSGERRRRGVLNVSVEATLTATGMSSMAMVQLELVDAVCGLCWTAGWSAVSVLENAAATTHVARLTATHSCSDDDADAISYYIVSGDPAHAFIIDNATVRLSVCLYVTHT